MDELALPQNISKPEVFDLVRAYLDGLGLKIEDTDDQRPWGGFFVIHKDSTDEFLSIFYPEVDKSEVYKYGSNLTPKIILVAPGQKLSWQYHNRRAELWKVVLGPIGVMDSETDATPDSHKTLNNGELIQHDNNVRHRLIGLDDWGAVAEIWQHTDPNQPSDENDIVRLEDDYGRN